MSAVPADETNPAAADWLHRLYDGHDGWLTVFAIQRHTGTRTTVWRTTDQIAGLVEAVAALEATCDLWFGVATRHDNLGPGQRGGAEHCRTIPGLWVDIDVRGPNHAATDLPETFEQAVDLVQAFPLAPTAIVATGGGLQAWWLFAEPVAATDARPLLARWGATWADLAARHGWHIDNVFDLARIMRLPGTTNRKNDPQPVEVVGVDWTIRYGVDDLEQWTIEPPAPPTPRPAANVPYIGPERPGDAYNARHSVEDVLADLGFEPHARRLSDGSLHYRWPGASNDVGATAYPDGHATIWSETFCAAHPAAQVRRPYDAFGLVTVARHAGNYSDATRALRSDGYGAPHDPDAELAAIAGPQAMADYQQRKTAATVEAQADLAVQVTDHGWHKTDVRAVLAAGYQPPIPALFARPDGKHLLYAGRINGFFGESGSGKSWMAMHAAAHEMNEGRPVLYVDLEDHCESVTARLVALGVDTTVIGDLFHYVAPEAPYSLAARAFIEADVTANRYPLVVIDSTGEAMALDGAKQNDDDEVAQWHRKLPRAIAHLGPCVVLIDHVPKASDAPANYSIGSQRKRAAIDGALYRVDPIRHPAKGHRGEIKLTCAKDRNGTYTVGQPVAHVVVDANLEGSTVDIRVQVPTTVDRPTELMERVSRYLETHPGATQRIVCEDVKGRAEYVRKALDVLVADRLVRVERQGQAMSHYVVEPFRRDEIDDLMPQRKDTGDNEAA